jgi:CRP-like cAMP-binding protein
MEAAKLFFTWYVAHYTRYNLIYGSLETVVVLMFWTFYVALILLFCAELISSYGRRDQLLWEKAFVKIGHGRGVETRLFRRFGRVYPRGAYIFREGDRSRNLYYLLKGRVQLEKRIGLSAKVVEEKSPGDFFGEMALLLDAPRAASGRAIVDSEIVSIDGPMLTELFHHSAEFARRMLVQFAERLRQSYGAVNGLSHAILLLLIGLTLSREKPPPDRRDPAAALQPALGYDPEEIRTALGELTAEGILRFHEDGEAVLNPEKLREKILFMTSRRRPGSDG